MSRRLRPIVWSAVALAGGGLFILLLALIVPPTPAPEETVQIAPVRSSYNQDPDGTQAFHLLLKRGSFKVEQWLEPMSQLKERKGVLIIIDPGLTFTYGDETFSFSQLTREETEQILAWVADGNALLLLDDTDNAIVEALRVEGKESLAREQVLVPLQPVRFTRNVRRILAESGSRLATQRLDALPGFGDEYGSVLLTTRHGNGRIVLLSEPALSSNAGIGKEDHVPLLTNIVEELAAGEAVLFDERHHTIDLADLERIPLPFGAGSLPRILIRVPRGGAGGKKTIFEYFWEPPKRWVVLQLLVAIGLLLLARAVRFGSPVEQEEAQFSTTDHLQALSRIFRRANVSHFALEPIYREFRRSIAKELGLSADADVSQIERPLPRQTAERIREIVAACERALQDGQLDESKLLQLAKGLEACKQEVDDYVRVRA